MGGLRKSYVNFIRWLARFLMRYNFYRFVSIVLPWTVEPRNLLRASYEAPFGLRRHFNYHNLNPKEISEEQAQNAPLLLLHGNYHNQSAWFSFGKRLAESKLSPVYTLNLPFGLISQRDYHLVMKKFSEIKSRYQRYDKTEIKINLVGNSRGGELSCLLPWVDEHYWVSKTFLPFRRKDIGKVILLGASQHQGVIEHVGPVKAAEHVFEVFGEEDVLVPKNDDILTKRQILVPGGHVGLLYSPLAHEQMIVWLYT